MKIELSTKQKKTDQIEETDLISTVNDELQSELGIAKDHLAKLVRIAMLMREIDYSTDDETGWENCLFVLYDLAESADFFLHPWSRKPLRPKAIISVKEED